MEITGTDTYELVRACISHQPEAARRDALRSYLRAGADWENVLREAARHGVCPLLVHNLEHLLGGLPSPLCDHVQESRRKRSIHANFLVQELGRIYELCEDNDLPLLTLKGPVLADRAYGGIAMRRYIDLDILIPEGRFSELDRLLRSAGYEYPAKREKLKGWRQTVFRALKGQWQYTRGGGVFNLDVHTRIMPPGYPFPADFWAFWERSEEVQLKGRVVVKGLAPEDQALMLSYHGVKNYWRSLRYVADIAQLVRAESSLNWSALVERARKIRATRTLGLGLSLARDVLDVSLPLEIQRWAQGKSKDEVQSILARYLRNCSEQIVLSLGNRMRLQFSTRDTVIDQFRYGAYSTLRHLWSTVFEP